MKKSPLQTRHSSCGAGPAIARCGDREPSSAGAAWSPEYGPQPLGATRMQFCREGAVRRWWRASPEIVTELSTWNWRRHYATARRRDQDRGTKSRRLIVTDLTSISAPGGAKASNAICARSPTNIACTLRSFAALAAPRLVEFPPPASQRGRHDVRPNRVGPLITAGFSGRRADQAGTLRI